MQRERWPLWCESWHLGEDRKRVEKLQKRDLISPLLGGGTGMTPERLYAFQAHAEAIAPRGC
jgi:hypothetical protein